jgi:hypothetical protein
MCDHASNLPDARIQVTQGEESKSFSKKSLGQDHNPPESNPVPKLEIYSKYDLSNASMLLRHGH